eukprot:1147341-Pleurochrysis_carterae.AAC.1
MSMDDKLGELSVDLSNLADGAGTDIVLRDMPLEMADSGTINLRVSWRDEGAEPPPPMKLPAADRKGSGLATESSGNGSLTAITGNISGLISARDDERLKSRGELEVLVKSAKDLGSAVRARVQVSLGSLRAQQTVASRKGTDASWNEKLVFPGILKEYVAESLKIQVELL